MARVANGNPLGTGHGLGVPENWPDGVRSQNRHWSEQQQLKEEILALERAINDLELKTKESRS